MAIVNGSAQGGAQRVKIAKNSSVVIEVTADSSETIHIHGYDIESDVGPAQAATFSFNANVGGVFVVEIHRNNRKILELEVK